MARYSGEVPPCHRLALLRLLALAAGTLVGLAQAQGPAPAHEIDTVDDCQGVTPGRPWRLDLRLDNDLLGGQDEGYTGGMWIGLASPRYHRAEDTRCLPRPMQAWQRLTRALEPAQPDGRQFHVSIGQALWTPSDGSREDLIVDDRPYAAAMVVSLASNVRQGNTLHVSTLRLGMVGPVVGGRHLQSLIHRLTGSAQPRGWSQQLHNEPVFQLGHQRLRRVADTRGEQGPFGWSQDVLVHAGGAVGNLATLASVGAEWRFGRGLDDDFGSLPLRPGGEAAGGDTRPPRDDAHAHAFLSLEGRWLLHDISLDGNSFRASHAVERRPFVLASGYGVAMSWGGWKLVVSRYHRTREFDGQQRRPVFGSITLARTL